MNEKKDLPKWKKVQQLQREKRCEEIREYALNSYDGQSLVMAANEIEKNVTFDVSRDTTAKYMKYLADEYEDMRVEENGGAMTIIYEPEPPYKPSLAFRSLFDYINGKTYDGRTGTLYFVGVCGFLGPLLYSIPVLLTFVVDPIPAAETLAETMVVVFFISVIILSLTIPRTDPSAIQTNSVS